MLNECLKNEQSQSVEIMDCNVQVCDTGIPVQDSLNLGPKRLAKQRVQRMRRSHNRSVFAGNARLGWATKML